MAELILSGLLKKLGCFLDTPYEADRVARKSGIEKLRNELDLLKVYSALEYSVEVYAAHMRDAAVLIEDVLDVYDLLAANRSNYLRRTGVLIAKLISHENLGHNIENINALLVNILDKGERHGLSDQRFVDYDMDFDTDEQLRGAEDVMNIISEEGMSRLSAIAVLGGEGTGKTALAARIYNSEAAVERFEIRVMIAVPQNRDQVGEILRLILRRHWLEHQGNKVDAVREFLRGKRFLIVLDDVWSDELWHSLRDALPDDCVGSKVLITTRSEAVADSFVETTSDRVYRLIPLFDSWKNVELELLPIKPGVPRGSASVSSSFRRDIIQRSSFGSDQISFFSDDIED